MVQWFQKYFKGQFEKDQFVKRTLVYHNGFRNVQILRIELALSDNISKKRPNT